MILVKTPIDPLEASVKIYPMRVKIFAAVVGSKHAQIAVGEVKPA